MNDDHHGNVAENIVFIFNPSSHISMIHPRSMEVVFLHISNFVEHGHQLSQPPTVRSTPWSNRWYSQSQ